MISYSSLGISPNRFAILFLFPFGKIFCVPYAVLAEVMDANVMSAG